MESQKDKDKRLEDKDKKLKDEDKKLKDRVELIGLRIAFYRKRRGLTQEQLAELTDKSRSSIARIEARGTDGPTLPSIKVYYQIADALNIPITKIIGDDDELDTTK